MKKIKRHLALILALLLIVSACIGNGSAVAFATESSSDMATEDVEFGSNEVTKETEAATEEKEVDTEETEMTRETSESGETDLRLESEYESAEEECILNMEAIEEVVSLFEELPAASDLENMTPEEVNEVMQRTQEAMDAFDAFSYDEGEFFINNYSELYNAVMNDLGTVLADMFNGDAQVTSLLPLEESKAYLLLYGYQKDTLSSMSVDTMLDMLKDSDGNRIQIASEATTVWKYTKDSTDGMEEYSRYNIGKNETINIYPGDGIETFQFEIIIGCNGQLNTNNKRYSVTAYLTENFEDDIDIEIYLQNEDNTRTKEVPDDCKEWVFEHSDDDATEEIVFDLSFGNSIAGSLAEHGTVLLNIKSKLAQNPRVNVEIYPVLVYDFGYVTIKDPIADQILNQNMEVPGTGYAIPGEKNTDTTFQIVTYVDGVEYSKKYICVRYWNWYPSHQGTLFSKQDEAKETVFDDIITGFDAKSHISEITFELKPDIPANNEYYFDYDFVMQKNFGGTSENYAFEPSSVKLTLTVNENTDDNVFNATDIAENYSILNSIGVDNAGDHHYILEESADTVFRSEGELKQFVNLWLNGVLLEPGVDYIAESGSTKITIKAQTFDSDKTRKDGQRNTIAAEFRTTDTGSKNDKNNSNELRRTSQNFYIEKHTHSYDGGTITKAPTCSETGVRTYTCNTCGNKYTETIAALGHFSGEGKVTKKATCTDNGEKSYFCIRCNTLMRTEAIIAVGHDYSVKITQGGDCKTDGIKTYTCKNCGDSYTETIKATGHKYVVEVTIEPTETTDGLRTFTCSVCNDKFTEVIPALGDGTHLHTYDEGSVIKEATCLENGMMAYTCTQCGAIKQETILSKGHNYSEEVVTEATCTESGLKKLTCVNCGDSYTAIIAAKGHSYDQGVVTKQPTNTETGIKTYTCSACGNSYTEVTPMINSTPVYGGLNNPGVETAVPNNQVACIVRLIDSNENPIGNTAVELHSTPQCFVTDSNGYVRFSAVDFGVHTLYVSNADGERISKEFRLASGNSTSLEGDVITAEPGTAIVLTVVFDGNMLEIKDVQRSGSPETGDNSALVFWYILMLVSLGCIVVMSYFSIKKKISNRH